MSGESSSYTLGAIYSLQTLCTCLTITSGQYIYSYYLDTYPVPPNSTTNFTTISPFALARFNENNKKCVEGDDTPTKDAQAWAQERSADLFFWTTLISSCPIILMTYILGLYTPQLGKRFVLVLPMFGTLAQFAIWLAIIYFHLPEYWWYITAVVVGFSGSSGVLCMIRSAW